MTPPQTVICRGGRSCSRQATHATLVRYPGGLASVPEGWEPLCWSHAIEDAIQVGHEEARHMLTLCSLGYALDDDRPLVRYVPASSDGKSGYEVLTP